MPLGFIWLPDIHVNSRRLASTGHDKHNNKIPKTSWHQFSQTLLYRHLMRLRRVADQPSGHFMRNCVFEEGSNNLNELKGPRKPGRLQKCWNTDVYRAALEIARAALDVLWSFPSPGWKRKVSILFWCLTVGTIHAHVSPNTRL